MRVRLLVPVDVDVPTGGNVYDLALAEAMRHDGDEVDIVRCEPADLAAVLRDQWRGPVLVDGLLASPHPGALAGARPAVLVHMPLAWRPEISSDEAAELDLLEAEALESASVVVATSRWTAHYLTGRHRVRRVEIVPPGVDRADVVEGSDPPLIVQLAAVAPHKNQLGLVQALAEVADLPWTARLAGALDRHAGYVAEVRRAIEDADLSDRVRLTGVLPRDAAWAGADLAVLPSLAEAYGMVVTEALARGIPAIVTDGGPAEALGADPDGRRPGAVVPIDEPGALAVELRRWLNDPGHRYDVRRSALARRESLEGWDVAASRMREALATGGIVSAT
jgi:glycosyltransferase involved in cell wall biosynthesis